MFADVMQSQVYVKGSKFSISWETSFVGILPDTLGGL